MHELKLFVTGYSPTAIKAIENFTRVANAILPTGYRLEIVDVLRQPHVAAAAGVFCTPMLVKTRPEPEGWLLGDLTDETRLARVLMPEDPRNASVVSVAGRLVRARELAAVHGVAGESKKAARARLAAGAKRIVVIDDYEEIHDLLRLALDGACVELISAHKRRPRHRSRKRRGHSRKGSRCNGYGAARSSEQSATTA